MRRAISAARLFTIRHLLGPVEIARLRMKPGDAVIVRITERVSPDEFYAVSRRAVALIPEHFHPLVVGPGFELSRLPRDRTTI